MNCLSLQRQFCKGIGLICAVVALFSFVHEAQGTYAYLPVVGAPALRIETATTNSFNYLAFSRALSALEAKTAEAVSNAASNAATLTDASAAKTNNISNANNSKAIRYEAFSPAQIPVANNSPINANNPTVFVSAPMPGGGNISPGALNFAFPSSTASDLLTVTPQMITQYLKPDTNETNQLDHPGAIVFVPADMPFMPPTQNAPGSRAIYQSR